MLNIFVLTRFHIFEVCLISSLLCSLFGVVAIKKAFEIKGVICYVVLEVKNNATHVVGMDFAMVGYSF